MSYLISLNPMLFKNIAHVWPFNYCVFVYLQDVQGVHKMCGRCARCVQDALGQVFRFCFFYWPSGGTLHHWQPHTNMDLYIKTRRMYCLGFLGGQKRITSFFFHQCPSPSLQRRGCSTSSAAAIRVGFASQDPHTPGM